VPALSAYVLKANQMRLGKFPINMKGTYNKYRSFCTQIGLFFKGLGVGDGWISPLIQYGSYGPFALLEGLITRYVLFPF